MPVQASAGISFSDRSLRYAEIQQTERGFRLLRLGQCDFDFDLNRILSDPGATSEREVIGNALREALGTSADRRIRAALHPPLCRSFFSAHNGGDPVPGVSFEAKLLGLVPDEVPGGIGADAAAQTPDSELLHVTSIRPSVLQNLGGIIAQLAAEDAQAVSALRASSEVIRLGGLPTGNDQCCVAVGFFENLFEMAVVDSKGWRFAMHSRSLPTPDAAMHHITQTLGHLGWSPDAIAEVLAFGPMPPPPSLKVTFSGRLRVVNPLSLLDLDRDSLDPDYSAPEFVPAVGAALL